MALFGHPEYQIGRGEVAESRLEMPMFAAFMLVAGLAVLVVYIILDDLAISIAVAVTLFVFGSTLVRVDVGVAFLVVAMLLSPEIDTGPVGLGRRNLHLRYDDVLIIVVFFGVLVKQAWEGDRALWMPSPINAGIVLYYAVAVLATVRAMKYALPFWDQQAGLFTLGKMAQFYMVFFMVANAIRTRRQIQVQLALFFIVAVCIVIYAIVSIGVLDRVSAPFEEGGTEPNTLGGYLVVVMSLAGALFCMAPTRRLKFVFASLIVVAFIPLMYTLSRASYVSFLVAILALGLFTRRMFFVAATVVIVLFYSQLMPEDVQDRVNYTFQRGSGEQLIIAGFDTGLQVDSSTHERVYVWEKVRHNLRVWPWLGGGVGWDNVLDSQYARVMIETGLLGMAAFIFMQWRIMKTMFQTYRWSRDWLGRALGLGTLVASIGLVVHCLGTISFLIIRIMEPFWFLAALAVVARSHAIAEYTLEWEEEQRARFEAIQHAQRERATLEPPRLEALQRYNP